MPDFPIQTDSLIPHVPPMKMIDCIISFNDETKSSLLEFTVSKDSPFVNANGILDGECFLEIIAQAAAAQHGLNLQRKGEKEEQGFLVGARNVKILGQACAGDTLTVQVECGTEIESVSSVFGNVRRGEEEMASAAITVWHGN